MTPVEWIRIAGLVFVVLLFPLGYLKGCSDEKEDFDAFKAQVEAAGKAQEDHTKVIIQRDRAEKEKADAQNRADIADLNERLRHQRTRTIVLPAPAACPASADAAARYRDAYQRAYRELVAGLRAEADRGSKAVVDLNTAKKWAQTGGVQ